MKVLIGATLAWLAIGAALGVTLFMMTVKGVFLPFFAVLLIVIGMVKVIGCNTH